MRGSRESLLHREAVLRALNTPKNADKGCWKGMANVEAYALLVEEVLELSEELFVDDSELLHHLREAAAIAAKTNVMELKDDLDPERIREEYDDVGGAHLILGDVAGCLKAADKLVVDAMRVDKAQAPGKERT